MPCRGSVVSQAQDRHRILQTQSPSRQPVADFRHADRQGSYTRCVSEWFGDLTQPLEQDAPAPRRPLGVIVRVLHAQAEPATVSLEAGTCVIGSAKGCDLIISDKAVSRRHVELGAVAEGVTVEDLGSRNGTFYSGQRVEKMLLGFGGRLQIGSATIAIEADTSALDEAGAAESSRYGSIVGESAPMRLLFGMLERLEGSKATILIEGESGVGKELVARALHAGSLVANGPLVAVNCGAFPRELVASELFGHSKGAFSGASDVRRGAFESAHGGTLFLDEVAELPVGLQPMLLRALELGEVRALGDDQVKHFDVRVIAATNRVLEAEVRRGSFRQDLFYRLAVVRLAVPPLRERRADIKPLARHFAEQAGLSPLGDEMLASLAERNWPGNARELKNAIVSLGALGALPAPAASMDPDLEEMVARCVDIRRPFAEQKEALVHAFARRYLSMILEHTGGNQSEAARMAGLNRSYMLRLLAKYELGKGNP